MRGARYGWGLRWRKSLAPGPNTLANFGAKGADFRPARAGRCAGSCMRAPHMQDAIWAFRNFGPKRAPKARSRTKLGAADATFREQADFGGLKPLHGINLHPNQVRTPELMSLGGDGEFDVK